MTIEKIYEDILNVISLLPEEDKETATKIMKEDKSKRYGSYILGYIGALTDLAKDCEDEIYKQEAKKQGRSKAKSSAEKIIKIMEKSRPVSAGAFIEDDMQYIGCNYMVVRLKNHLPIQKISENPAPFKTYFTAPSVYSSEVKLPTKAELSAYIKTEKAKKNQQILWVFEGEGTEIGASAEYLQILLDIIGYDSKMYVANDQPESKVLYLKSNTDNSDAILMPIGIRK